MDVVKVDEDFRITIPDRVREVLDLAAGDSVDFRPIERGYELVRVPPLAEMRGFLQGTEVSGSIREKHDRF